MDKKFLSKSQWNKFISFLEEGENSNLRGKDKNFFFFSIFLHLCMFSSWNIETSSIIISDDLLSFLFDDDLGFFS